MKTALAGIFRFLLTSERDCMSDGYSFGRVGVVSV
jgi:hypothetical protein